ncbi:MAG: hypothetical protein IT287_02375 [Bdellovibrionaceae bacterium]|nr:hypothetical protein [Pseudobdellovibrionaceae bacterium]
MGNRETKYLLYTLAATFVVLLALTLTGGRKTGSSMWSFFNSSNTSQTNGLKVPKNRYAVVRYGDAQEPSEKIYKNSYKPSTTYARAYVEPQEVQQPIIASAKFVSKQDKLKKAKKRKALLAKNAKNKKGQASSGDNEDDGFFDEEDDSSTSANNLPGGPGPVNATGTAPKKTKEEEEKEMNTVEFWEKPIFVEEDFKAVVKLIESYQVRKVSNNVFYTLVDDMTHDERPNLREYGLVALTATPSSKSFSELAWLKHNDDTTDIRSNAGKELTNYTDANRVNYVVGALRANTESNPKAALEALSSLTETSKKYTTLRMQNDTSPEPTNLTNLSLLEPRLDSALQLIQSKYSNSPDPKIKSEADKTVAAINSFIAL